LKKLLLVIGLLLVQACNSDSDWVQEERFVELATKALLEEYPDLEEDEVKAKLAFMMIHCQKTRPCTASFFFQRERLGEPVQVSVSEDGKYWIGNENSGAQIYYDPST